MNRVERYIEQVNRGLVASKDRRERLLGDLRTHIEEATAGGESEQEVLSRLGRPEEVAAAYMEEIDLQYAGFWERFFAFICDCAICFMMVVPWLLLAGALAAVAEMSSFRTAAVPMVFVLAAGLTGIGIFVIYFPLLEARFGKTLGKHLMGIRVVGEHGVDVGAGPAILRRLSLYFELLVPDALFIPFTEKKQRALDILAKTVVVKEPGGGRGAGRFILALVPVVVVFVVLLLVGLLVPLLAPAGG